MSISFNVNGALRQFDQEPDTPLLWVVRDALGLTGTKFGCGVGACGACTVMVDGVAQRSCITPVEFVDGAEVTTVEGLANGETLNAIQQAWIAEQVPQCGYCQSGMIMAVTSLLAENPDPTDEDIDTSVTNLCRCGTYVRIRRAIKRAAATLRAEAEGSDSKSVMEANHG